MARSKLLPIPRALRGDETVELLHRGFAWGLLGLVAPHTGGATFASLGQRENLVRAMLDGEKRAPQSDDVV